WRHRGRRGNHVARHARRALRRRAQDSSELLPADDRGHGGRAFRRAPVGGGSWLTGHGSPSLKQMNPQLQGVEDLEGTYLFDLERSTRGLRLNRFLHGLTAPASRALFGKDPEAALEAAALTAEERRMVRDLDWAALIRYGASFFCLEKLARVR